MVLVALKWLVSKLEGWKRERDLAYIAEACQVQSTLPVTASKKYAMMQEMGEDI